MTTQQDDRKQPEKPGRVHRLEARVVALEATMRAFIAFVVEEADQWGWLSLPDLERMKEEMDRLGTESSHE